MRVAAVPVPLSGREATIPRSAGHVRSGLSRRRGFSRPTAPARGHAGVSRDPSDRLVANLECVRGDGGLQRRANQRARRGDRPHYSGFARRCRAFAAFAPCRATETRRADRRIEGELARGVRSGIERCGDPDTDCRAGSPQRCRLDDRTLGAGMGRIAASAPVHHSPVAEVGRVRIARGPRHADAPLRRPQGRSGPNAGRLLSGIPTCRRHRNPADARAEPTEPHGSRTPRIPTTRDHARTSGSPRVSSPTWKLSRSPRCSRSVTNPSPISAAAERAIEALRTEDDPGRRHPVFSPDFSVDPRQLALERERLARLRAGDVDDGADWFVLPEVGRSLADALIRSPA